MFHKEEKQATQLVDAGFIKFVSRVDLFLPLGAKLEIVLNQTVKGEETIITNNE